MTSQINFSGLGSNIDFSLIRDAIVANKMQPVTQLATETADLSSRSSALTQLNGLLATLTNATTALTDTTLGTGRSTSSSNNAVATASATAAAGFGSLNLVVNRLAGSLTQASQSLPSTSAGILAGGATTATFELRKGGASSGAPITIDSTNNSLAGLRDAINAAHAGVTASIVDIAGDGTQNQLVLTSTATGTAGRVQLVETTATGTGAALNLRTLNPPGAVGDFSALDAQLSINGLTITRSSNTISDAVTGVTLNLQQTGNAAIAVTQSADIANDLETFVNAYNGVQSFVNSQYKLDSANKPTGVLAGDSTLRLVQRQLQDSVNAISTKNGGALKTLSDIGIGRDSNGKLTLDTSVLNTALQGNVSDVQALLFGQTTGTGLFNSIHGSFNNLSDNINGVVQTAINGYQGSIKTINQSIADQTNRVNDLKNSLTLQFAKIDAAIGQLNSQATSLTTIINALLPKTTN